VAVEGGPIAQAAVELVADVSRFDDDVRVKVTAAASAAGKDFDRTLRDRTRDTGKQVGERVGRDAGKGGTAAGTAWGQSFRNAIAFMLTHKALSVAFAPLAAIGKTLLFSTIAAGAASAIVPLLQFASALSAAGGIVLALPAALAVGAAFFGTFAVAVSGVGAAFSAALSGDADKFAKSIEHLAPAAQSVARELFVLKPRLLDIRNAVQGALFGPLQGQLTSLADTLAGPVRDGMVLVATEAGEVGAGLAGVAREAKSVDLVRGAFATTAHAVETVKPGLLAVVGGFRDLGLVALPILGRLSDAAGVLLERFGAWLTRISESGQATAWIEQALVVLHAFGVLLVDVGGIVASVFRAAATGGGDVLGALGQVVHLVNEFLASGEGQAALISVFQALGLVAETLRPVLQGLIGLLGEIAPIVAQIAVALGPGLVAAIAVLYDVVNGLGPALVAIGAALSETFANETLRSRLGELATAIGNLLSALAPILPVLGQVVAFIAGGLVIALQLATPLVTLLVAVFTALWPVLEPILVALAAMAVALSVVVGPLLAWIAIWGALAKVIAVVKIAWLLLNIAFAISPIGLIIILVVGLVAAFIYLWNTSEGFRAFFIGAWEMIKNVVGAVLGWLGGALSAIGGFFADLPGQIGSALGSLGSLLLDLFMSAVSAVLNFLGSALSAVGNFFAALPGQILDVLTALPGLLLDVFLGAIDAVLTAIGVGIGLILVAILVLPGLIIDGLMVLGDMLGALFTAAWNLAVAVVRFYIDAILFVIFELPGLILSGLAALGEMLVGLFTAAWNLAVAVFHFYVDLIMFVVFELPGRVLAALAALGGLLIGLFTSAWTGAVNATLGAGRAILGFLSALPGQIAGFLAALPGIIGGFFRDAWAAAQRFVLDGINKVVGAIASAPGRIAAFAGQMLDAGRRLIASLFDGLSQVGGFAGDVASAIVSGIKSGVNYIIDRLNSGIASVWPDFAGSPPQIPRLAHGGIITHRIVAEIGEAGPEVVIPLTRPRRAAQLAQESGLLRILADQQVLAGRGGTTPARAPGREVHINAPITVHAAATNPLIVARWAADHIALLAQA
jgi:phage-related protein